MKIKILQTCEDSNLFAPGEHPKVPESVAGPDGKLVDGKPKQIVDRFRAGETVDVPDRQARSLIRLKLAEPVNQ